MAQAKFSFISDASGGDQFTVTSFSGTEAISSLYRYEIEVKAPLTAAIVLDDLLDSQVRFVTEIDGKEYPVYGVLSSLDELRTVQDYVHYRAVLVPKLWRLSIYKTNEIYTQEKTVDAIIQTVLENSGFSSGTDFDLSGLDNSRFLERDYVCQFGESDFDFISRLMENEGIFFYFEHGAGPSEKIIFINDLNYPDIQKPDLIFDVAVSTARQYDCINAWSCRKQRLAASVTVRDFNPDQPSLDISDTAPVDSMGQGTEYIYGENIKDKDEATYLSEIRAEEQLCTKTRYYGESSVTRLQAGYLFALDLHPNAIYNGVQYLAIEISHEGQHLDMALSGGSGNSSQSTPQYRNSFAAIESREQYRPPRKTIKPRFYGTMTAFVYAETGTMNAEIDEFGRYRVHLPFDRADGTMNSDDPDRKASTWMRMAQPYVGQEQGMYFPLAGGTEVLLTFINGDPDQPIISGALPNASQPSLLTSKSNLQRTITAQVSQIVTGNTHRSRGNSARIALLENPPPAPNPTAQGVDFINQDESEESLPPSTSMIPPWLGQRVDAASPAYDENLIKFMRYDKDFVARPMADDDIADDRDEGASIDDLEVNTDRSAGDNYVYANGRTFAYPQHERVYFIGTFHEDFHVRDDFTNKDNSWTKTREVFHFPEPGGDATQDKDSSESDVNPKSIRGVSEDKRWGDQMTYAWGRVFNWSAGAELDEGNACGMYNYGNGYSENLLEVSGYTVAQAIKDKNEDNKSGLPDDADDDTKSKFEEYVDHKDDWTDFVGDREDNLKDCKNLQADTLGAEKTFGNTYSYQMGYAVDIHEGHSESRTYGDTTELVEGDANSTVKGVSTSVYHGRTNDYFMGGKHEMNLAGTDTISLSADFVLHVGLDSGIQLAGFLKFAAGVGVDITAGPKFEGKQFNAKAAITELETKVTKINLTQGALIEEVKMTFLHASVELDSSHLKFGAHNLAMIG